MPTYAIETSSSGTVTGCSSWSEDNATLPSGYAACSYAQYTEAKNGFMDSLKVQAQNILAQISAEASLLVAMGETFGAETRAYVSKIQAIANGTDTTSTALPTAPTALTL